MTTNTTQSAASSTALEARGLVPFVNDLQPRCPKCPRGSVAQALLPVRFCCARAQEMAHIAASLPCISPDFTPFTLPHPRKLFLATRHPLVQRRNTADEGPLSTEFLIANPELEFRLTHRKLSQLKISNRKKIAIFHPVFRRGAKNVFPPSFPSGRGFIPSASDHAAVSIPIVYPEDAPRRRRAQLHPRKPVPRFASPEFTPFVYPEARRAQPNPRKPLVVLLPSKKNATSICLLPFALSYPRKPFASSVNSREFESIPLAQPHPRKPSPFFPFWHDAASRRSRSAEFLIANGRLEFAVSHSKEDPLKIPNRERIAISNRIQTPRPRPARHLPHITCLPRGGSPPTKGDRFSLAAVAANRNSRHFRISPNSHSGNTYAFSNRNKSEYCLRFGGPAFFNLAANHRAQFTRHSQSRPQIDPAAAHAYTDPSTEGESSWKIPSY